MDLKDKVLLITGASRGIGLAIALKAAADGAKIAVAAKTQTAHAKLPGTIFTAAEEIKAAGGEALSIACDVRDEEQVKSAIAATVEAFGGIDIVVNNAGAIQLTDTEKTDMSRFDLMQDVNARAVYMVVKHAFPHLKNSDNAHVLNLSPPLNLHPGWLGPNLAYALSKYGMTLCTIGHAEEFKDLGIAVNSLWPETVIDTSAVRNILGDVQKSVESARKPEIVADAAYWILTQKAAECTGNCFIDAAVLKAAGATDLSAYLVDEGTTPLPDFFVGEPKPLKVSTKKV
ncbi:MAG: short chain dehydrogenase [Cyanobacteria bacterium DS2.3.42]|nr:short chain dehydrogenase [Cyanobacteria bacterium DS2.3.42]